MAEKIITIEEWRKKHRDYKTGDPRRGTAKMVYWDTEHGGTVLGPVVVLDNKGNRIGPKAPKECKS